MIDELPFSSFFSYKDLNVSYVTIISSVTFRENQTSTKI